MDRNLERTMRMNYLYDFYHSLLTDKQKKYIELYYLEDFSFSEISETLNVTRQAAYDNIKRSKELLEHYESNLNMYHHFEKRKELLDKIQSLTLNVQHEKEIHDIISQLKSID